MEQGRNQWLIHLKGCELAASQLGLSLIESAAQKGYEATDEEGSRYRIKTRTRGDRPSSSWDFSLDER